MKRRPTINKWIKKRMRAMSSYRNRLVSEWKLVVIFIRSPGSKMLLVVVVMTIANVR